MYIKNKEQQKPIRKKIEYIDSSGGCDGDGGSSQIPLYGSHAK